MLIGAYWSSLDYLLAETEGFAYMLQAAVWLASQTLRIPHAMSAGTSLAPPQNKMPASKTKRAFSLLLAETEGFEPSIQV
jgi:hypothetical protein